MCNRECLYSYNAGTCTITITYCTDYVLYQLLQAIVPFILE